MKKVIHIIRPILIAAIALAVPQISLALDIDSSELLKGSDATQKTLDDNVKKEREAAAKRARERDRTDDVCFTLPAGSDAQTACLGKHPMAVRSEVARNLLLGNCGAVYGDGSDLNKNLSYACSHGVDGCFSFKGDAAYWCKQSDASKRWLAVYSYGYIIKRY